MKPDRKLIDEIIANNDAIEAFCNPGPGAPAWNGSGLPPVGVECEAHWSSTPEDVWYPVVVIGHDMGDVVFRWKGGERKGEYSSYKSKRFFRPLKTAEQLAAEQREKAIVDMCQRVEGSVAKWNINIDCSAAMRAVVEALYDLGARLPK